MFVIDESDVHQFSNSHAFKLAIISNKCICLTGSPDNNDESGLERRVLNTFNLYRFNSIVGRDKEVLITSQVQESKTVSLENN